MSVRLVLLSAAAVVCMAGSVAHADPLPVPSGDFALKAKLRDGGTLDLFHAGGKMRLEILPKASPSLLVGIVDLKAGKMAVMVPSMPKMAVEMDLPPEYGFASLAGNGTRTGTDVVAGEPCDLWKVDPPAAHLAAGPSVSCITADGIALRTEMEIQGKPQVVFEMTSLTRGPQDPHLFALPPGIQTLKIPKGAGAAALPGLIPGGTTR